MNCHSVAQIGPSLTLSLMREYATHGPQYQCPPIWLGELHFFGNGLNRLSNGSASWEDLLKGLAESAGVPEIMDNSRYKPFTLLYEQMSLGSTKKVINNLKRRLPIWLSIKGSVPNGTKLSRFSAIFTPVFYLYHLVSWCG